MSWRGDDEEVVEDSEYIVNAQLTKGPSREECADTVGEFDHISATEWHETVPHFGEESGVRVESEAECQENPVSGVHEEVAVVITYIDTDEAATRVHACRRVGDAYPEVRHVGEVVVDGVAAR